MAISDKNSRIYIKISKDLHEWLREESTKDDRNVSNLVNVILKRYREDVEKDRQK